MTREGFNSLQEELKRLKKFDRPNVIRAIAEAAAHGDLSENAEYDAAKEKQSFIEGRIKEIETKIATSDIIDVSQLSGDRIVFGATVTLAETESGNEVSYKIVGVDEADVKAGKISVVSPLARGLIGKEVDDEVKISTPSGIKEYEILGIEFK